MSNLLTDVTPVLLQAFPTGNPEMSASDFDRALKFVQGRANGSVPRPGPHSMDYAWWAHTMIVSWRMLVNDWQSGGKSGPEPKFLLCPECDVMMLLDMSSGDVLMCPGGCHRAIRVNTFVELFKRPAIVKSNQANGPGSVIQYTPPFRSNQSGLSSSSRVATSSPKGASLSRALPKGSRPEDYGITEGVQRHKTALFGWRIWYVNPFPPYRLRSISSGADTDKDGWPGMTAMRGTCSNKPASEITDHKCPSWEHRCGVHAVKDADKVSKWGAVRVHHSSEKVTVIGEIEMWGRVLEYEEGFRAEWAYPLKLYVPSRLPDVFELSSEQLAEKLWETYLTEVVVDDDIFNIP